MQNNVDWRHVAAAALILLLIVGALWRRSQTAPEITSVAPAGAEARMQDPP
jgi:hypothetical protein